MIRWIAIAALSLLPLAGRGADVAGVKVPDTANIAGQELVLNGAGLRAKAFFKIYVAALYLPAKKRLAGEVIALPGPKRISMVLQRDITAQQLIDALNEGILDNHTAAEVEKLRSRAEMLSKVMATIGAARSGSIITLDYVPAAGTQVGLDGSTKGAPIPGDDFYRALLKIWLGDDPVDASLKKAMLGGS